MGKRLGAASLPFIACVALFASAVLLVVSFASPYWAHDSLQDRNIGLWRYASCRNVDIDCQIHDLEEFNIPGWLNIVRGLEMAAIVFVSLPLVILPVYMYVALGLHFMRTMIAMLIMAFLASVCMVGGVAVFAWKAYDDMDLKWCLVTCVVAAVCSFVACFILIATVLSKRPKDLKPTYYPSELHVDPNKPRVYVVQYD